MRFGGGALLASLALAGWGLGGGCSVLGLGDEQLDRLRDERRAWERAGVSSYDVVVRVSCFCGPETLLPVRLEVRDRVTVRAIRVASGDTVPDSQRSAFPNVDELFDRLETHLRIDDAVLEVSYDPVRHYPAEASGHIEKAADSGLVYTLTDFTVR